MPFHYTLSTVPLLPRRRRRRRLHVKANSNKRISTIAIDAIRLRSLSLFSSFSPFPPQLQSFIFLLFVLLLTQVP